MISKIYALPTRQTIEYMTSVFQGSPLLIDPEIFGVELGSAREAGSAMTIGANPGNVYRALPGLMKVWYDTASSRSYWTLPLIPSPEMVERHEQIGDAWGRVFVPFIKVAEVQNMRRRNVSWMNSIATGLATTKPILTFHNELVMQDDSIVPTCNDFYEDYVRRGMVNNDLFIDLTDPTP